MPSRLGMRLQAARKKKGIGLRELARSVDKSPALISRLENEEQAPTVSPDTLRAIAKELGLDTDEVLLLASRTEELAPKTATEMALYRKVKDMPAAKQKEWLKRIERSE
jgi:transcriptional regulator with XRE-family HTH domain